MIMQTHRCKEKEKLEIARGGPLAAHHLWCLLGDPASIVPADLLPSVLSTPTPSDPSPLFTSCSNLLSFTLKAWNGLSWVTCVDRLQMQFPLMSHKTDFATEMACHTCLTLSGSMRPNPLPYNMRSQRRATHWETSQIP